MLGTLKVGHFSNYLMEPYFHPMESGSTPCLLSGRREYYCAWGTMTQLHRGSEQEVPELSDYVARKHPIGIGTKAEGVLPSAPICFIDLKLFQLSFVVNGRFATKGSHDQVPVWESLY